MMKNTMNEIIREEVQKFAEERPRMVTGNDFRFTQQVPKLFFYNYSILSAEYDVDVKESNIVLTWQISFLVDSKGVKKMLIESQNCSVEGPYNIELYDIQTNQLVKGVQKNIEEDQWKITTGDDDVMIMLNEPLRVKDLEFDFKSKVCKITFENKEPQIQR